MFSATSTETIDYDDLVMEREIGRGSFGIVWQALYHGTPVAVKQITPDVMENSDVGSIAILDPLTQRTLAREVAVLQSLRHPNIIYFLGLAEKRKQLYLVTEYVDGGNLGRILSNLSIELPWTLRSKIILDVASAMAYLHSKNVIFRDLKTENILVDTTATPWKAKLCDFGFARPAEERTSRPMTMCGSDDWMAPEVILGLSYGIQADVFSFGMIILETVIRQKISDVLVRLPMEGFALNLEKAKSLFPPDVDLKLANIGLDCCVYEPKKRPSFKNIVQKLTDGIIKSYAASASKTARKSGGMVGAKPVVPPNAPMSATSSPAVSRTGSSLSDSQDSRSGSSLSTSQDYSKPGYERKEDLRKLLLDSLKHLQMRLVAIDLEGEKISSVESMLENKHVLRTLIDLRNVLAQFPTGEDDAYEERHYEENDAKVALFKKHMDFTLWEIRSKLYEIRSDIEGSESLTHLMDLAKTFKQAKAAVAEK